MSIIRLIPAAVWILSIVSCSSADSATEDIATRAIRARGQAIAISLKLSVEAVELDKRLLTLKGPQGNSAQFKVGEEVKRLAEIHAGDTLAVEYKVAGIAELREPTAEEKASPLVLVQGGDRAPADLPPGAAFARVARAVTTIMAIDVGAHTLTVKGPLNGVVVVTPNKDLDLASMKTGQTIVVTFAESLLLTMQPGTAPR